jgi:hypothetical protein
MAYVIAEPCVDIKDKACIEESPVDCICDLGSPGGASKTGITENDPMAVKSPDRGRCGCVPASRREERLDFG